MTEWKTYKLGEIVTTNSRSVGRNYPHSIIQYLDTGSITCNHIDSLQEYNLDDAPSRAKRLVQQGDIIYSAVRPNQLHYGYIDNVPDNLVVSTGFIVISCNKSYMEPKYLYYYLTQREMTDYLHSIADASTSAYPSLRSSDIEELEISLPSLEEQRRIAGILGAIDDKIENNRRINANLEQQAQALYKQWFVDNRSNNWEEVELNDVAIISAGGDKPQNISKDKTPECSIPIYSNGIDNEGLYGYANLARIYENSITISARGTIGYVCLRTEPYVPIVRLISVIPKYKNMSAYFLYLWALTQNISGTGTTQQQLTVPDFRKTHITIPAQEKLIRFNNIVKPMFDCIKQNKIEIGNLATLRDTLLPKLMNGEIITK